MTIISEIWRERESWLIILTPFTDLVCRMLNTETLQLHHNVLISEYMTMW